MKTTISSIVLLLAAWCCCFVNATDIDALKYYDALQYRMINKGFKDTTTPFTRLPESLNDSLRPILKTDAEHSAGLGFRFATNSKCIAVRYSLTTHFSMMHMAHTGIQGTDLYIMHDDGTWHFVANARPSSDSIINRKYVDNLDGKMHEYMIYLPLYDGVRWMEIGVDSLATIEKPHVVNPSTDKKIVFYGTSITQGGCASRPGMVATSILQRELGVECINLGFSGEGRMDIFMAEAMASIPDVAAYVIDPISNCTLSRTDTITCKFINTLRRNHPGVPIFMVEGQVYAHEPYDTKQQINMPTTNKMFHQRFLDLKKENPANLYYIDRNCLIGPDGEGTVDGAHLTDLGFYWYAQKLLPYLRAAIKGTEIPHQDYIDKLYKQ